MKRLYVRLVTFVWSPRVADPASYNSEHCSDERWVALRYGPFRVDYAFNHMGQRKVHVTLVGD